MRREPGVHDIQSEMLQYRAISDGRSGAIIKELLLGSLCLTLRMMRRRTFAVRKDRSRDYGGERWCAFCRQ